MQTVLQRRASAVATVPLVAIGSESYVDATKTVSYGSTSTPGPSLTLVRYTFVIADAGQANDGRTVVVEWDSHADTTPTVTDTGGTPANRLDASQIAGNGAVWSYVIAAATNDLFVSSNGTQTCTLYVEDGVSNDSVVI